MRKLLDIIGLLLFAGGIWFALGGYVLGTVTANVAATLTFWIGVAMAVFGAVLSWTATHKYCPKCAETIRYKAIRCKHCGADLPETQQMRMSGPFYK